MTDDRLIEDLVGDLRPVRPRSLWRDAAILIALCAAELFLFLAVGGARPDMPMATGHMSFWWKLVSLGVVAVVGVGVALVSFDPTASSRRGLRWLSALAGLALLAGWMVDVFSHGVPAFSARVNWREGLECVYKIVLLSLPAAAALTYFMRRGAPTDAAGSSLSSGLAAAAWGAFVFVFACPHDDPLYIAIWYGVGCGLVTLAARLVLPWIARW
jgi:hypothetical protein